MERLNPVVCATMLDPSGHNKAGKSFRLQGGGKSGKQLFHPFAAGLVAILCPIRCSVCGSVVA